MGETWIVTQVELATQWERRHVDRRLTAVEITSPMPEPDDRPDPEIDPWAVTLEVPRDGREAIVEGLCSDETRVITCPLPLSPDGSPCPMCNGSGMVRATLVAVARTGTVRWLRAIEPRQPRGLPSPIVIHVSSAPLSGRVLLRREAPGIDDVQAVSAAGYRTAGPVFSETVRRELEHVLADPGLEPGARRLQQILEVREVPIRRDGDAWTIGDPPVPWTGDADYDPPLSISRVAGLAAIATTMVVLTGACLFTMLTMR